MPTRAKERNTIKLDKMRCMNFQLDVGMPIRKAQLSKSYPKSFQIMERRSRWTDADARRILSRPSFKVHTAKEERSQISCESATIRLRKSNQIRMLFTQCRISFGPALYARLAALPSRFGPAVVSKEGRRMSRRSLSPMWKMCSHGAQASQESNEQVLSAW